MMRLADQGATPSACITGVAKYTEQNLNKSGQDRGSAPKVLIAGVDSLYVAFYGTILEKVFAVLESLKEEASQLDGDGGKESPWLFAGAPVLVKPRGVRAHKFWLTSENAQIYLTPRKDRPAVMVHLHSAFLHGQGNLSKAMVHVRRFLADLEFAVERELVSRSDLFADVANFQPEAGDRKRFLTRAQNSKAFWRGNSLSGLTFGARGAKIYARLYDKRLEIAKSSQHTWFEDLWRSAGWDGEAPVWRVEFELRRDGLRDMDCLLDEGTGELRDISVDTVDDVIEHLPSLWRYCTAWLSLRVDNGDQNRSRWPLAKVWELLVGLKCFGHKACKIIRKRIRQAKIGQLIPQVAGCLSSMGALRPNWGRSLDRVIEWVGEEIRLTYRERGLSFEEKLSRKEMLFNVV